MSAKTSPATTDLQHNVTIRTTEMHTSGEPVRIIDSGFPQPNGSTLLEKRNYIRQHLDSYRKFIMFEPRGHYDMYGALLVKPEIAEADIGVIFMHNEGYSTMCGHAVIALGRYAVDKGLVAARTCPETKVAIQCPCGLVQVFVQFDGNKTGSVRFHSVPAFVFKTDVAVGVEGFGEVKVDISYGGAFYAFVAAEKLGLNLETACIRDVVDAADAVTAWDRPLWLTGRFTPSRTTLLAGRTTTRLPAEVGSCISTNIILQITSTQLHLSVVYWITNKCWKDSETFVVYELDHINFVVLLERCGNERL
ncbi:trans-L-3-hydroxyproline dehydratase-like isoform X1 [Gigantopelta aegis]|uniref:trans-L-3-hydroxyproline dehydratase-like isoform X1 n=1 Tax=Gigantopelta aegis TaxID=1735272 RepID=UPI001B88AC7E|nr:trans-L-3-hydroxyproline dehydratase-like isoform X1 [Gigantopelta aegis]